MSVDGLTYLAAAEQRRMPWKNGGGTTTEIATGPVGAAFDDFGWRVSIADVASDGPFSIFSGIDRTLAIIAGHGIALTIDGKPAATLREGDEALAFDGGVPTSAALLNGPIRDLNVMTRRGSFTHAVRRFVATGRAAIELRAPTTVFVLTRGQLAVTSAELVMHLRAGDALFAVGSARPEQRFGVTGSGVLFQIAIFPVGVDATQSEA